ncbi:MAG: hypothetical protein FWD02_06320, partial [Bacteroidales bacterium]|nr:hypothetical protein [Bacteroidales bacterium]
MKKLFTILLCGLFCMANLKAQSGSGTISDPSTTGDQLRTAILAANSGDRIYLTDMVVTTGLNFGGNDIDVVLASPDGNPVTITFSNPFTNSANGPFGLNFHGIMNVTLEFENVAINGSGIISAIRFSPPTVMNPYTPSAGVLTLIGANISNGRHGTNGGAVHVDHGSVVIENSTLTNNSAGANGGAVFVRCGTATITNSTFTGNTSHFNGGAVLVGAHGPNNPWPYFPGMGVVTITGSTFENNTATNGFGGGVMADGNIFMTDTEFIGNSANFAGNGWASNNVTQYDEVDHAIFLVTNRPVLTWFTDLATAVAAAESGETIRIYPGEYEINETIFIETPGLKLIGAVDSSGDPVTTIKAADVFTVISN